MASVVFRILTILYHQGKSVVTPSDFVFSCLLRVVPILSSLSFLDLVHVLLLHPFQEGSQFIVYDSETHRANLEDNSALAHEASYCNASRVTTYLRGGVEQMHGGTKKTLGSLWPPKLCFFIMSKNISKN